MPTSLLGEKGGYDCEYNISTAPLSKTSKYSESSQQRFHSKQVDFNDQKAELATLKDEKKVQGDEYLTDVVLKNQIYTSLVQSLHTFWYWKLPPHIRKALHNTLLASLPRCFMVWWLSWSEEDPAQFPMPAVISNRFPHYELDEDDYDSIIEDDYDSISPLLVDVHYNQTELGNFLEEAWNTIDHTDRLLMMFCWAACRERHNIRYILPKVSKADPNSIISNDLRPSLQGDSGETDATRKKLLDSALTLIKENKF